MFWEIVDTTDPFVHLFHSSRSPNSRIVIANSGIERANSGIVIANSGIERANSGIAIENSGIAIVNSGIAIENVYWMSIIILQMALHNWQLQWLLMAILLMILEGIVYSTPCW